MKRPNHWTLTLLGFALLTLKAHAQDMPLSMLLLPGEDWRLVSEGHTFTDAPCADDKGNFYFSDMRSTPPAIWKVQVPDGLGAAAAIAEAETTQTAAIAAKQLRRDFISVLGFSRPLTLKTRV